MMLDEGYIVCSNDIKNKILEDSKDSLGFKNYKFLSEETFIKGFFTSFKDEAISYLVAEKGINATVAKLYLSFLYIIDDNTLYESINLKELQNIKKELVSKNFSYKDLIYISMMKNNNITIINPKNIDLINYLKNKYNLNISIIEEEKTKEKTLDVHIFNNQNDELMYVFDKIKKLIESGVSLNDIKIANVTDDYQFSLNRIMNSLGIPFNSNGAVNALSKPVFKTFLANLSTMSFDENINDLASKQYNNADINLLINTINKYRAFKYEPIKLKSLFEDEIKTFRYEAERFDNAIDFISVSEIGSNMDKYVFLINFDSSIPTIKKDDDYLTDKEKKSLKLLTSLELNEISKQNTKEILYKSLNLTITYSIHHSFTKMIESPLILDLKMNVIKEKRIFGVDKESDDLYLAESLDNYVRFNVDNDDLKKYYYKNLNYNSYDNSYEKIDKESFEKLSGSHINLSYSQMEKYYKCPFQYYCSKILKVDEFEETLATRLGTYAHGILEKFENYKNELENYSEENDSFDFDKASKEMISKIYKDKEFPLEDQFYFEKSNDYIKELVNYNKIHELNSDLKEVKTEEKLDVVLHNGRVTFEGFVDKELINRVNGVEYIAVIDYKSYAKSNSLSNIEDGFNLQLPIYLYLISQKHSNPHFMGIYLQPFDFKPGKYDEEKNDYRLNGFTSSDESDMNSIYHFYDSDSKYLGIRFGNKGINKQDIYKLLNQDEFKMLIDVAKKKIEDMIISIDERNFEIKPKTIEATSKQSSKESEEYDDELEETDDNLSAAEEKRKEISKENGVITSKYLVLPCAQCHMRDICYKTKKDIYIYESKPYINDATIEKEKAEEEEAKAKEERKRQKEILKEAKEMKKGGM